MERWYSIVEYARKFNLSDMTVRRRIKNGKLQAVLKEGKYYIPISASQQISNEREDSGSQSQSESELRAPTGIRTETSVTPRSSSIPNSSYSNSFQSSKVQNLSTITDSQEGSKSYLKPYSQPASSSPLRSTPVNTSDYRASYQDMSKSRLHPTGDKQYKEPSSFTPGYDNLVQQFKRFEKILEDSYTSKINQLESELKVQKLENANLRQQVEDLQVLIKLIEKRK